LLDSNTKEHPPVAKEDKTVPETSHITSIEMQDVEGIRPTTRLLSDNLLELSICIRTPVKTIKPMVNLESTNDPDTLNQAQE
jgi:hypothetical protein